MGQKVNPHGLRVGVIKDWDSRWYANKEEFADKLVSDYNLRKYLKNKLFNAGVPKIEIERTTNRVKVTIHCAKPGFVIGKGGTEIEKLRTEIEKLVGEPTSVHVTEIKDPDLDAQLVKRVSFRRAVKLAIGRTMRLGARGIKISCSGRLAGAEIARTEHYHEGTIPLQTIRADIDYGFYEADTTYGKIGVKVWIYRGEVLQNVNRSNPRRNDERRDRRPRNRDGFRNDRRPGGPREGGRDGFRGPRRDRNDASKEGGKN